MRVFIHIPKTGGTTLVDIMAHQIYFNKFQRLNPTRTTHPKDFLNKVEDLLEDVIVSKHKIQVVGGHFGYQAHPKLNNPNKYFTILRDPVERVISEYFFMKYKGMYYQDLIESQQLSLKDYVLHPEIFYLNNFQTRLISGEKLQKGEEVTEDIFQIAVKNLKKFEVFGLTEEMTSTLALFYLTLDWERLPYYIMSNSNDHKPKRESISTEEIKAIEQREKYDLLLYEEARKIFNERISTHEEKITSLKLKITNQKLPYKLYLKVLNKVMYTFK